MALLLAVVMALIPLAIAPGWFFYFDVTPKVVLLLLGTAAAAIWWAATGGAAGFYRASRAARWFLLGVCGMAVSLVISTLASVNPALSLGGSNWRYWGLLTQLAALGFAYLVAACCAGRPRRLHVLLRSIAASGLIVADRKTDVCSSDLYWGLLTQLAALGFAYLVAACCAGRPRRLHVLLRSIAASGLIVALYGIRSEEHTSEL